MSKRTAILAWAILSGLASVPARAHITPPVVLASDREAVVRLLPTATRYIIAVDDEGVAIIDQHVAHERVLFEQVMERLTAGRMESQRLLTPILLELSPAQREAIQQRVGWNPDDDHYRFYVGRTAEGAPVAATVFLSEFTLHGPVRVAVAVGPDGKVTGALVVEVTEESYTWVKPVLDSGFLQRFVGRDARSAPAQIGDVSGSMPRFYARLIARLIARVATLYEVTMAPK